MQNGLAAAQRGAAGRRLRARPRAAVATRCAAPGGAPCTPYCAQGGYADARDAAGGAVRAGGAAADALGGGARGGEGRCKTRAAGSNVLPTRAAASRQLQHELRHGHQGARVCTVLRGSSESWKFHCSSIY